MSYRLLIILLCCFGVNVSSSHANVACNFTGAPSPWISNPHYYDSQIEAADACRSFASSNGKGCQGPVNCSNSNTGDCSWRAGYIEYWVDGVGGTFQQNQFLYCAGTPIDTDGDGIPDSTDPCPNNPNPDCTNPNGDPNKDTDGDGIPDDEDPCPNNPNPNCTDPNDSPGPTIPDEIPVGDCIFDLRSFKEWLNTDSAFPFNLLFRFFGLVTPLFDLTPDPPIFEINWDLSPYHDRYSYIPSTINFRWDFTPYDTYAKVIRSALILSIIIFVVSYGLNSTKERP